MRVFVSAQLADADRARQLYRRLVRAGHTITHDWTRTDTIRGGYSEHSAEAGRRAARDIIGVLQADAYVILTDNQDCGKGMYVELGAALAEVLRGNLRHIAVVGRKNHESIFYYHPALSHFASIDDYIEELDSVSSHVDLKKSLGA